MLKRINGRFEIKNTQFTEGSGSMPATINFEVERKLVFKQSCK